MVRHGGLNEAGKMRMGCLLTLLVLAAGVYFGFEFLEVRLRYYKIQDEVNTQASFASILDDQAIRTRLVARSDTLGLPLGTREWTIRRSRDPRGRLITIEAEYEDSVVIQLPGLRKVWKFHYRPAASQYY